MPYRLLPLSMLSVSLPATAHDVATAGGFVHGLLHPWTGVEHILAAVSVGILCIMQRGGSGYFIPLAFLFFMSLGGIAGMFDVPLPFGEVGGVLSVVFLGLVIAFNRNLPVSFAMAFVGVLALFHGYEHGMLMPESARPSFYVVGFLLGTALLQFAGAMVGIGLERVGGNNHRWPRLMGSSIAIVGSYLLLELWLP